MKKPVLLITAVGSLVGKVILDALEGRRDGLHIVGCDVASSAYNLRRCDEYVISCRSGMPEWVAFIQDLVCRFKPFALIPGIDNDVDHLSRLAEVDPEIAAVFVGGSSVIAKVISCKARMAEFAATRGLSCADTVSTDHPEASRLARELADEHGFPLIAKPADGSGSLGVRILTGPGHLEKLLLRKGMVIQPYLDAPDAIDLGTDEGLPFFWEVKEDRLHGVQIILGRDGCILGRCGFRSRMVRGRCEELWACDDADLMALGDAYAAAAAEAGWRGPLNIQAKRDAQGQWRVIELNGRFSGGTSSRLHFGFDEVKLALDEWLGAVAVPGWRGDPVRHVVRMLADYPVAE